MNSPKYQSVLVQSPQAKMKKDIFQQNNDLKHPMSVANTSMLTC